MYCISCGEQLKAEAKFCQACGEKIDLTSANAKTLEAADSTHEAAEDAPSEPVPDKPAADESPSAPENDGIPDGPAPKVKKSRKPLMAAFAGLICATTLGVFGYLHYLDKIDTEAFEAAKTAGTIEKLGEFKRDNPSTSYAAEAQRLALEIVLKENTLEAAKIYGANFKINPWSNDLSYTGPMVVNADKGYFIGTAKNGNPENGIIFTTDGGLIKFSGDIKHKNTHIEKTDSDGNKFVGTRGENGKGTGRAVRTDSDGTIYEGDLLDGQRTGKGKFTYTDGTTYEGGLLEGNYHGRGLRIWTRGERYHGQWVNGKRTGKGKYIFTDGDRYEGYFLNGDFHGKGKYTFADGSGYVGNFRNDEYHGKGKRTYPSGYTYEGDFLKGERTGQGIAISPYGKRYEGGCRNGRAHGFGKFKQNGNVYSGSFENGYAVKDIQSSTSSETLDDDTAVNC